MYLSKLLSSKTKHMYKIKSTIETDKNFTFEEREAIKEAMKGKRNYFISDVRVNTPIRQGNGIEFSCITKIEPTKIKENINKWLTRGRMKFLDIKIKDIQVESEELKTILYWLKMLPSDIYEEAMKNSDAYSETYKWDSEIVSTLATAINQAFPFSATKQGSVYWFNIYNHARQGRFKLVDGRFVLENVAQENKMSSVMKKGNEYPVAEWYKILPDNMREDAMNTSHCLDSLASSLKDALYRGFYWHTSSLGGDFWTEFFNNEASELENKYFQNLENIYKKSATVEAWFSILPLKYRDRAIELATKRVTNTIVVDSLGRAIDKMSVWSNTEEGSEYWREIYEMSADIYEDFKKSFCKEIYNEKEPFAEPILHAGQVATARDWFTLLNPVDREAAIGYISNNSQTFSTLRGALSGSFVFFETNEGYEYWHSIFTSANQIEDRYFTSLKEKYTGVKSAEEYFSLLNEPYRTEAMQGLIYNDSPFEFISDGIIKHINWRDIENQRMLTDSPCYGRNLFSWSEIHDLFKKYKQNI